MSNDDDEPDEESDTDDDESTHLDRLRELKLTLETMKTAAQLVEMLK